MAWLDWTGLTWAWTGLDSLPWAWTAFCIVCSLAWRLHTAVPDWLGQAWLALPGLASLGGLQPGLAFLQPGLRS